VPLGPRDPILGVAEAFKADTDPRKVNVGVGAYRTDEGKPWTLPSVKEAEKRIFEKNMDHEYAAISGIPEFVNEAAKLAYGANSDAIRNKRVAAVQSLSGTGALRLAAGYFALNAKNGKKPVVLVPNPTWGNHFPIFRHAGIEVQEYRYWDPKTLGLDLSGLLADIKSKPEGSVVLLHSCAHNPTGVDPTLEQWKQISKVCLEKGHFVLFDNAYQGFASGDAEKDVASVRQFINDGHNIGLCQSFAKNFGLYGERIGAFSILCKDADEASRVESQIKIVARAIYSNPPIHGARIVGTVLGDPKLKSMWLQEISQMSGRIIKMRSLLKDNLKTAGSKRNWDHITNQIGMFSYTGVSAEQCDVLTKKHHVYLTSNGRISMAGVTSGNVKYLAEAFHNVTK
jgi:aspartate aminotransferase